MGITPKCPRKIQHLGKGTTTAVARRRRQDANQSMLIGHTEIKYIDAFKK